MRAQIQFALVTFALVITSSAFAAGPILVTNGDFSAGLTGWTGGGIWFDDLDPSHDNKLQLELPGFVPPEAAIFSQTLAAITPDMPMLLSFEYLIDFSHSGPGTLSVRLNDQVIVDPFVMSPAGGLHFHTVTTTITDPALMGLTNPILNFEMFNSPGLNTGGFFDNISLTAVPEPSLLSVAALALLQFKRRRA